MNAQIIAIGDEILQGYTLNTNANFLAKQLTDLGFVVENMCAIGDDRTHIIEALDNSVGKYNLILLTGGLGPTSDDITKKILAEYFDGKLVENQQVLSDIVKFAEARGFVVNEHNRLQAQVPSTCEVIRNPIGSAPAMLFEKNNSIVISMPGVPFEMKQIFAENVVPVLKNKMEIPSSCLKIVQTLGVPESIMVEKLKEFEQQKPENIKLAYLPSPESLRIKLLSYANDKATAEKEVTEQVEKLKVILKNNIFGIGETSLEMEISKILKQKNKTLSTAESCTGGHIAHKLTSISGSSMFFRGSVIAYSNGLKIRLLGVGGEALQTHGAVSEQIVREMAVGALQNMKTDYVIAVSGIAGPTGGTTEKPVGTTWIAVGTKDNIVAEVFQFGNRRDINIRKATSRAMFMLLNFIKNETATQHPTPNIQPPTPNPQPPTPLKIGNIELPEYPLLLAPMEDITEPSFRHLCKKFGADLMYTEFVASEALIRDIDKSLKKLTILDEERPVGIQIYGHQISSMVEAAKIAAAVKPDLIDINYGCPVKKIATRGAGAGMLKDIPKMVEMTKQIVKAVDLPVTVKTRLGWDLENLVIEEIAERLQDVGIQALTIHGRTRSQFYKGEADWTLIGKIKNNPRIKIPIIGNGDIDSPQRAKEMFDKYNVDAIMIGRATIGRPQIFREIKHYLQTNEILPEMTIAEKVEMAKEHLLKSLEWKGMPRGIYEMRRHLIQYFKAIPNFKNYRLQLVTTTDVDEIIKILDTIKKEFGGSEILNQ